ncbi:protein YgfX [Pseudoduganella violacea]|uniref:Toxin CptA n=1 Tax=Pseudoduganella violacea TaxID=1715466 RepID=A0A7W5BET8_9BURK|nr:protein YgfX [Pseudoduganella violacea]MBB3121668.1 toxin CptA [Pseudoduganella violacea]
MSIATTAIVRPSPVLRMLQAAMCVAALAAGLLLERPMLLCLACAGLGWQAREVKVWRIDISAVGQLRLTVYQGIGGASGPPLRLLPGTLLWPAVMLLWLEDGARRRRCLVLLPDSVAPTEWRALALALRALAA